MFLWKRVVSTRCHLAKRNEGFLCKSILKNFIAAGSLPANAAPAAPAAATAATAATAAAATDMFLGEPTLFVLKNFFSSSKISLPRN